MCLSSVKSQWSALQSWFKAPNNSSNKAYSDVQSPPYEAVDTEMFNAMPLPIPQWSWSKTQCRYWIKYIGLEYFELSLGEVDVIVGKLNGAEPTIMHGVNTIGREYLGKMLKRGWCIYG